MSINIFQLTTGIGLFAILLTLVQSMTHHKVVKSFVMSLLQNFAGALFVFSGYVKAVDPLGTAYKMEQYFAEFETTFAATKLSFLAPIFPALAEYAVAFAVFMVVFEIFLGVNLLTGLFKRFTAWAFFLLVLFFTFLTGFTYLTGYVPEGVNFFEFSQWGDYVATNMKVTDCGCFGDFLKLEPRVSFIKDLVLLVPAFIFLWGTKSFHVLENGGQRALAVGLAILLSVAAVALLGYGAGWRTWVMVVAMIGVQFLSSNLSVLGSIVVLTLYSMSNYVTDIPQVDFRPFNNGKNVATRKALETEAETNVKVLAYKMTNKSSGEVVELPYETFLEQYADFPAEDWEYDQIKSEPEVARTKISDFEVSDKQGNDLTESILSYEGASMMIVAYKLYGTESTETVMLPDSIFTTDTVMTATDTTLVKRLVRVGQKESTTITYNWDPAYVQRWKADFLPKMEAAAAAGVKVYAVTAYSAPERLLDFQETLETDIPFFNADDILLKTIVRSNPGPVLMKNGAILHKWHHRQMPDFATVQASFLE